MSTRVKGNQIFWMLMLILVGLSFCAREPQEARKSSAREQPMAAPEARPRPSAPRVKRVRASAPDKRRAAPARPGPEVKMAELKVKAIEGWSARYNPTLKDWTFEKDHGGKSVRISRFYVEPWDERKPRELEAYARKLLQETGFQDAGYRYVSISTRSKTKEGWLIVGRLRDEQQHQLLPAPSFVMYRAKGDLLCKGVRLLNARARKEAIAQCRSIFFAPTAKGELSTLMAKLKASCDAIRGMATCVDYPSHRLAKKKCPSFEGRVRRARCPKKARVLRCLLKDGTVRNYYGVGQLKHTPAQARRHCKQAMGGTALPDA